jgi:hypothetical protein
VVDINTFAVAVDDSRFVAAVVNSLHVVYDVN